MDLKRVLIIAVATSFCTIGLAFDGPQTSASHDFSTNASRDRTDLTVLQQLKALQNEVFDHPNWDYRFRKADENIPKMLDLVRSNPDSDNAFEVLEWVLNSSHFVLRPAGLETLKLLSEHQATNTNITWPCFSLGWYSETTDAWKEPSVMNFLRTVVESNPNPVARGHAALALARLYVKEVRYLECFQSGLTAMRAIVPPEKQQEYQTRWHGEDLMKVSQQAEHWFDVVLQKYASSDYYPKKPGYTLGETAAKEKFELQNMSLGKKAPDIQGKDLNGVPFKLSDYRGKTVVLSYWASWCVDCMKIVPQERALVERMAGKPFVFIGVNGDHDSAKAKTAAQKYGIKWRSFADGGPFGPISASWNVLAWPTTYVIDQNGIIRFRTVDGVNLDAAVDEVMRGSGETGRLVK